jgi:hypothetical protein
MTAEPESANEPGGLPSAEADRTRNTLVPATDTASADETPGRDAGAKRRRGSGWRRRLAQAALVIAGVIIAVGGWTVPEEPRWSSEAALVGVNAAGNPVGRRYRTHLEIDPTTGAQGRTYPKRQEPDDLDDREEPEQGTWLSQDRWLSRGDTGDLQFFGVVHDVETGARIGVPFFTDGQFLRVSNSGTFAATMEPSTGKLAVLKQVDWFGRRVREEFTVSASVPGMAPDQKPAGPLVFTSDEKFAVSLWRSAGPFSSQTIQVHQLGDGRRTHSQVLPYGAAWGLVRPIGRDVELRRMSETTSEGVRRITEEAWRFDVEIGRLTRIDGPAAADRVVEFDPARRTWRETRVVGSERGAVRLTSDGHLDQDPVARLRLLLQGRWPGAPWNSDPADITVETLDRGGAVQRRFRIDNLRIDAPMIQTRDGAVITVRETVFGQRMECHDGEPRTWRWPWLLAIPATVLLARLFPHARFRPTKPPAAPTPLPEGHVLGIGYRDRLPTPAALRRENFRRMGRTALLALVFLGVLVQTWALLPVLGMILVGPVLGAVGRVLVLAVLARRRGQLCPNLWRMTKQACSAFVLWMITALAIQLLAPIVWAWNPTALAIAHDFAPEGPWQPAANRFLGEPRLGPGEVRGEVDPAEAGPLRSRLGQLSAAMPLIVAPVSLVCALASVLALIRLHLAAWRVSLKNAGLRPRRHAVGRIQSIDARV